MKVGFYPILGRKRKWARTHPWTDIATASLVDAGCEVVQLDHDDLRTIDRDPRGMDVLHLNWPPMFLDPSMFKHARKLPRKWFEIIYERELSKRIEPLRRLNRPIAWQVHDLPSGDTPDHLRLATRVFEEFFAVADGLIYYEASAQPPIDELLGPPGDRVVGVAPLGEYTHLHGEPIDTATARQRRNLPADAKIFIYSGTVRASRNPGQFIEAFKENTDPTTRLIVTGRGVEAFTEACAADERITLLHGLVEQDTYRDLMCAADFVVNDAHRYLGSAVIRVALGYGKPVIASPFGCTADLARDAFIPLGEHDRALHDAIDTALRLTPEAYQAMSDAARRRDAERPWSAYANGCIGVYKKIIEKHTNIQPRGNDPGPVW